MRKLPLLDLKIIKLVKVYKSRCYSKKNFLGGKIPIFGGFLSKKKVGDFGWIQPGNRTSEVTFETSGGILLMASETSKETRSSRRGDVCNPNLASSLKKVLVFSLLCLFCFFSVSSSLSWLAASFRVPFTVLGSWWLHWPLMILCFSSVRRTSCGTEKLFESYRGDFCPQICFGERR